MSQNTNTPDVTKTDIKANRQNIVSYSGFLGKFLD